MRQLSLVLITAIILSSCATISNNKTTEPYTPTFQNNLPDQSTSDSLEITIGLLGISYALDDSYRPQASAAANFSPQLYKYHLSNSNIGRQFQQAMTNDFEETLNKRGFLLKGPYDSYNNMVYSDRTNSDLILQAQIDVYPEMLDLNSKHNYLPIGYKIINSTARIGGHISLTIFEPMTKTKLWTRSVPVPDRTFTFEGEKVYTDPPEGVFLNYEPKV